MLDAEVAAILLNRHQLDDQAAGDLLREGNLDFVAESGDLGPQDTRTPPGGRAPMTIESLLFADGSRAFRVGAPDAGQRWSRWTVVEPFDVPALDGRRERAHDASGRRLS